MKFDFSNLVIFEMANNHQGRLSHGLKIIEEMAKISRKYNLRSAIKLQYRDLDTFVHARFRSNMEVKHIPRFFETRLTCAELHSLVQATHDHGMFSVITCFDEPSVDQALDHGVDALKAASCSAMDWPLQEALAKTGKPIICSTGGCGLAEIDRIVGFFEQRGVTGLALLHCVATYPTEDRDQQLSFMRRMMARYPGFPIGYSGHESPDNLRVVVVAVAMGAQVMERHVGLPAADVRLNPYSMNPEQTARWVEELLAAKSICGPCNGERIVSDREKSSLASLTRGIWARRNLRKGEVIDRGAIYLAMPLQPGQTPAMNYLENVTASRDYAPDEPLRESNPLDSAMDLKLVVYAIKGLLREARIYPGIQCSIELSHHYGMDLFHRFGAAILLLINREYCKKLIILLPGQTHPAHAHLRKEETFQILYGQLELSLEGKRRLMSPGDLQPIKRDQYHSFSSKTGCVFEEISTTHLAGDSVYEDERIARLEPAQRKTIVENW